MPHAAGVGAGPVTVECLAGLDSIRPELWSKLNPRGGLFTDQRFMAAMEDAEPLSSAPARVYAANADDTVLGMLPAFGPVSRDGGRYDAFATARSVDPRVPETAWQEPVVFGSRAGYDNKVFLEPRLSEIDAAAALRALVIEASDGFEVPWSMPYLDFRSASAARAALPEAGDALLVGGSCVLDVPKGGFDEYLETFRAKRRTNIRRELRRFDELGYTVEQGTLAEHCPELTKLILGNLRKYGQQVDARRMRSVFERYAEVFQDDVLVLLAREEGRTVAYTTVYRWGDALYLRSWGTAPGCDRTGAVYFKLVFYEPVRLAYSLGARRIHLGPLAYEGKVLRGARLEPRWTFLHCPHGSPATPAVRQWNDTQLARFKELTGESWQPFHEGLTWSRDGGEDR